MYLQEKHDIQKNKHLQNEMGNISITTYISFNIVVYKCCFIYKLRCRNCGNSFNDLFIHERVEMCMLQTY